MLPANSITEPLYSTLGGDPDLGELVTTFVARLPDRRLALSDLFASASWTDLERAAHQLKGAAGSYGFDALTTAAAKLEQALKSREDQAVIFQALESVVVCCNRCRTGVAEPIRH